MNSSPLIAVAGKVAYSLLVIAVIGTLLWYLSRRERRKAETPAEQAVSGTAGRRDP